MLFPEVAEDLKGIFPEVYGRYGHTPAYATDPNAVMLYGIRHTQTDIDAQDATHGNLNPPLNLKGLKEANDLAENISTVVPTRIVSSPMLRARMTANALSQDTGVPVEQHTGLGPLFSGIASGMKGEQAHQLLEPYFKDQSLEIPGGESVADYKTKVFEALSHILGSAKNGDKIAVVGHSITLKAMNAFANKKDIEPLSYTDDKKIFNGGNGPFVRVFKFHPASGKFESGEKI